MSTPSDAGTCLKCSALSGALPGGECRRRAEKSEKGKGLERGVGIGSKKRMEERRTSFFGITVTVWEVYEKTVLQLVKWAEWPIS